MSRPQPSPDPLHAISRARRRAIWRAIRYGEAVRDPQDAPLAVLAAERVVDLSRRARRFRRWLLVHVAVLVLLAVVFGYVEAVALAVLGLAVIGVLAQRRLDANALRAADANRRLAAAFGLEIPGDPLARDARSVASVSLSVRPVVAVAVVAGVMVAVLAAAIALRDPGDADTVAIPPTETPLAPWIRSVDVSCRAAHRSLGTGGLHTRNDVLRTMETAIRAEPPPAEDAQRPAQALEGLHRAVTLSEDAERYFDQGQLPVANRFLLQARDWGAHAAALLEGFGAKSCAGLF
jgi:hypothetical protein